MWPFKRKKKKSGDMDGRMVGGEVIPRVHKGEILNPVISKSKLDNRIRIIEDTIRRIELGDGNKRKLTHWKEKLEQTKGLRYYFFGRK